MMNTDKKQYDISEILKMLPHRYPFIMIDRIVDVELGKRIVGYKNITMNENFFQGHFPSQPVMPGVLILEGMAQAGAVLAFLSDEEMAKNKLVYFAGLDGVRFRRKVIPGDQLFYELIVNKYKKGFWKLDGKAFVDEQVVAEAQLMATFA